MIDNDLLAVALCYGGVISYIVYRVWKLYHPPLSAEERAAKVLTEIREKVAKQYAKRYHYR